MTASDRIQLYNLLYKVLVTVALIVCVILLFRRCGDGKGKVISDTLINKTDTILVPVQGEKSYIPEPYAVYYPLIEYRTDTLETFEPVYTSKPVDTIAILKDYLATRLYADTQATKYGNVIIADTITRNRVMGRSLTTDFLIPIVTRQITIQSPQRAVGYVNVGLWGNEKTPLFGSEIGFSLKAKNEKIYSINGMLTKGGELYGNFRVQLPIRLKKR